MVKLVELQLIVQVAPLPDETVEICRNSDAVLLGAVGGPKWDNHPVEIRPERGLLKIRKELKSLCKSSTNQLLFKLIGCFSS